MTDMDTGGRRRAGLDTSTDIPDDMRRRAQLTVAHHAVDRDDLTDLLGMLGLTDRPATDADLDVRQRAVHGHRR